MSRGLNPLKRKKDSTEVVPLVVVKKTPSLDVLFAEAESFGKTLSFQSDDGTFSANITFPTPAGIELKAQSGHKHPTRAEALQAAIAHAKEIKGMMK